MSKNLDGELFEEAESKAQNMKSSNKSNKMEYDVNMIIKSTNMKNQNIKKFIIHMKY